MSLTSSFDTLRRLLVAIDPECEPVTKDEFLFLYPFLLESPEEIAPLWNMVYGRGFAPSSPPTTDRLVAALRSGNWRTADKEARKIVDQVLDLPGAIADQYQEELILALEFLEVQPLFQKIDSELVKSALWGEPSNGKRGDLPSEIIDILEMRKLDRQKAEEIIKAKPNHPRIATLRFVALRNEFAREVPDGWVHEIRKKVPQETWSELENSVDIWLKEFPQHPLADLASLWKTRIYYFKGDTEAAWRQLLSVYPRHLPRVLYEMRYLLVGYDSGREKFQTPEDPLLFTALLSMIQIDSEQWERWWRVSEENIGRAWAVNLQERLLEQLARSTAAAERWEKLRKDAEEHPTAPWAAKLKERLPVRIRKPDELPLSFPKEPRNPTQLWGKLRAVVLMYAGRWEDARKQLCSLTPDDEQALLFATYHFRRGEPLTVVSLPDLPDLVRLYLVRVILADEELGALNTQGNSILEKDTLIEQGVRLAAKGQWTDAAQIIGPVDPARSELWREIGCLSFDTSAHGLLQLARFLRDNRGKVFYDSHPWWHPEVRGRYRAVRSFKERATQGVETGWLPWKSAYEVEAATRYFLRTTELWMALQAYVQWLSHAEPSPEMSQVVKEADFCYNRLVSPGHWNSGFWSEYLQDHPVVKKLREAGKRAKQR